jgi:hypothetical protein
MPWLTHTLIFIFLCELKSCHWMVRSAVEKSPQKKVGLMMMFIIWKNSLKMLHWQEFFVCTKLLLTLLSLLLLMSFFFSVVEYSLQAGRQSTEVINSSCAYFVREILFFCSFWSSLLWLLFLDCRHSFVNLFPHFFCVHLLLILFFPSFCK